MRGQKKARPIESVCASRRRHLRVQRRSLLRVQRKKGLRVHKKKSVCAHFLAWLVLVVAPRNCAEAPLRGQSIARGRVYFIYLFFFGREMVENVRVEQCNGRMGGSDSRQAIVSKI